jgi:NTE family protein
MWEVMNRQKDIQYSSRAVSHIQRQRQIHRMRHIIAELSKIIPEEKRRDNQIADLASYGCLTRMHVVRLLAPALDHEDHSKDIDFSAAGIRRRREAGYRDTMRTLEKAPWRNPVDELEGFVLHEASGGEMVETAAADER